MTNTSPRDFSLDQLTVTGDMQPTNSILLRQNTEEIIRVDKEGFHYNGQFIADAGEAHRLLVEFLRQNTKPEPERPTAMEIIALADEIETEELGQVDLVRRALARWGRLTIEPVPVNEKPWEREGWCDSDGWCWCFDADGTDPCWSFDRPEAWVCWTHVLPHYALPVPPATEKP